MPRPASPSPWFQQECTQTVCDGPNCWLCYTIRRERAKLKDALRRLGPPDKLET